MKNFLAIALLTSALPAIADELIITRTGPPQSTHTYTGTLINFNAQGATIAFRADGPPAVTESNGVLRTNGQDRLWSASLSTLPGSGFPWMTEGCVGSPSVDGNNVMLVCQ